MVQPGGSEDGLGSGAGDGAGDGPRAVGEPWAGGRHGRVLVPLGPGQCEAGQLPGEQQRRRGHPQWFGRGRDGRPKTVSNTASVSPVPSSSNWSSSSGDVADSLMPSRAASA